MQCTTVRKLLQHGSSAANNDDFWEQFLITLQNNTKNCDLMKRNPSEFRQSFSKALEIRFKQPCRVKYSSKRMCEIQRAPVRSLAHTRTKQEQHSPHDVANLLRFGLGSQPSLSLLVLSYPVSGLLIIVVVAIRPPHLITVIFWFEAPTCHYCEYSVSLANSCHCHCDAAAAN